MACTPQDTVGAPGWLRLHHDVLSYIFAINGDMFSDEMALNTTRHTSQVCRAWRELMLATPSLWGKLIDLDVLSTAAQSWRDEMLRRSGSAPLWIMSMRLRMEWPTDPAPFFFKVLDAQWFRIQRLVLNCNVQVNDPARWAPLYRPAPCLEICELPIYIMELASLAPGSLFANAAPVLLEFHIWYYPFDLHAPWVCNLRSVHMDAPNLSLPEVATALRAAANLEILSIQTCDTHGPLSFPSIHLPKLRRIMLRATPKVCITLLESIVVPHGCSLCYRSTTILDSEELAEDSIHALGRLLSRFAHGHFQVHKPTKISLTYGPNDFWFQDKTCDNGFYIHMYTSWSHFTSFPPHVITVLLRSLALPEFSHISEAQFDLIALPPLDAFTLFLSRLPSLEVMDVDRHAIPHLLQVPRVADIPCGAPGVLFPSLRVVKLMMYVDMGSVMQLVTARRSAGYALAVVDLTQCRTTTCEVAAS